MKCGKKFSFEKLADHAQICASKMYVAVTYGLVNYTTFFYRTDCDIEVDLTKEEEVRIMIMEELYDTSLI